MGFTSLDQRQPGCSTNRPISPPPIFRISACPWANFRTSSAPSKLRCSVFFIRFPPMRPERARDTGTYLLNGKLSSRTVGGPVGRNDTQLSDTATRILDVAERLVEVRGFNGFSYADVSVELNVTPAALHYHFANKADLGVALVDRYTTRFDDALQAVETRTADALERLGAYADLYLDVLSRKR